MLRPALILSTTLLTLVAAAQMGGNVNHTQPADQTKAAEQTGAMGGMKHDPAVPSTTLMLAGWNGETRMLSANDLKTMPHTSVTVINAHSHQQETYSGVAVKDLLAAVTAKTADPAHPMHTTRASRMTVVIAEGTDHFRIAMTICDTDPACRSGQAIVADSLNNQPLTTEGAFKLILTEDKTPGRWVRNLSSLTEKNLGAM